MLGSHVRVSCTDSHVGLACTRLMCGTLMLGRAWPAFQVLKRRSSANNSARMLGLANTDVSEGENPLSLGDGNPSSTVDEHAHNFLDTLLDLLELGVVET